MNQIRTVFSPFDFYRTYQDVTEVKVTGEPKGRTRGDLSGKFGPVLHRPDAGHSAILNILPRPCAERPLSPPTRAAQQLNFPSKEICF